MILNFVANLFKKKFNRNTDFEADPSKVCLTKYAKHRSCILYLRNCFGHVWSTVVDPAKTVCILKRRICKFYSGSTRTKKD